jgi:hypothetical protein
MTADEKATVVSQPMSLLATSGIPKSLLCSETQERG